MLMFFNTNKMFERVVLSYIGSTIVFFVCMFLIHFIVEIFCFSLSLFK
jgi:hypothetical protein